MPPSAPPRKAPNPGVVFGLIAGLVTSLAGAGAIVFLLISPEPRPLPPPVVRPELPAPPPAPPVQSAPAAAVPEPAPTAVITEPAPAPAPLPKKPAPARRLTNEEWGAQQLAKRLKGYDYCGREAILRKQDLPRRYRLRARFDANGEGMKGRVAPSPVAMLNACIRNRTKYVYLGKPPEAREFEVVVPLSFAHLRPKGEPETHDEQWDIRQGDLIPLDAQGADLPRLEDEYDGPGVLKITRPPR